MRKKLVDSAHHRAAREPAPWLDLEQVTDIELTSEDPAHPIENAVLSGRETGWRAAHPGPQRIRMVFNEPQRVRRIQLRFVERDTARTQEFTLRWSADEGRSFRDIVRQQWNFSPGSTTTEGEDYEVDLSQVTVLELMIVPDVSGGDALASVERLRVA